MKELDDLIKIRDRKKELLAKANASIAKKEKSISNKKKNAISNGIEAMEKELGIDAILILIDKYVESKKDRETLGLSVDSKAKPDNIKTAEDNNKADEDNNKADEDKESDHAN